ncbi:hypothetical protein F6S87_00725 [Bifidobacterium sp. BRDM6]|uniref:Uncharacterized protein n=2 Tax=Bifidobacterium choloepi TaxID=2614131 RepID=A0A6I5NFP1_9BIFI|nr:hypothetical protein [Bifidobacterium choloepi]
MPSYPREKLLKLCEGEEPILADFGHVFTRLVIRLGAETAMLERIRQCSALADVVSAEEGECSAKGIPLTVSGLARAVFANDEFCYFLHCLPGRLQMESRLEARAHADNVDQSLTEKICFLAVLAPWMETDSFWEVRRLTFMGDKPRWRPIQSVEIRGDQASLCRPAVAWISSASDVVFTLTISEYNDLVETIGKALCPECKDMVHARVILESYRDGRDRLWSQEGLAQARRLLELVSRGVPVEELLV